MARELPSPTLRWEPETSQKTAAEFMFMRRDGDMLGIKNYCEAVEFEPAHFRQAWQR